ncbi:thioredoxin family protein [Methylobacter tundripaludum]|uniref:thioredoxin family protein n=1 Tax=Methylobacter tundripaludum TaxID=173365 RepID=UPI0004DF707B|nr:thioredoxin family protein [Methylobacter tundripaludum]
MNIKILGSGCAKCKRLEQLTREVAIEHGINAQFEHVYDIAKIMEYPVLSTPALVIDEEVKVAGRMPSKDEIEHWLAKP